MAVLAIDAGTTGVTALVVTSDGAVAARGYAEFAQRYPRPGWVEHDPELIWRAVLTSCARAREDAGGEPPTAVGLTNQRETVVVWDTATLRAPRPAIVWQDRRTARVCAELAEAGYGQRVTDVTGLRLDPYFSGTKLSWLATNEPELWAAVHSGRLRVGTVDTYLLARMSGGTVYATEPSNASRTLLYDTFHGAWSDEMADLLGVTGVPLPAVLPSAGVFGHTDPEEFLGLRLPIAGVAGDQQAALFGQVCLAEGDTKCTYGTGSFVLTNTGATPVRSGSGLLTTVAWDIGAGPRYALEGAIFVTGAAVAWLRDGLGVIGQASEVEELAASVPDTGGVVFVPALTGLGAPDWDPDARGLLIGLTRGTTRAHLARATLAAIAHEVRDVVDLMVAEAGLTLSELSVDGGASGNDLLCQLQADQLGAPVRRPVVTETTGLGAAFLAGLATGVWSSPEELRRTWRLDKRFSPTPGARDDGAHERWREAVHRARGWATA